jgi:Helix-turn-helix of DDE superfamily endonuclease/DDE superfamily endonuclease
MLDYPQVKRDRRKFLALTGLTLKEFKVLLPAFVEAYQGHYPPEKTVAGQKRQRQCGGGRQGRLATAEQQLLFILVYQKTYPLQVVLGELFGMSQSGANQWVHRLLPVLRDALHVLGVMPERTGRRFAQAERGKKDPRDYIIDGTERRRQRPQKPEKQALHYSGKKKTHSDKNVVIVNTQSKRVGYLSPTYPGKTHDKKLAECEQITYSRQAILHKDTGFQGYEPYVKRTYQPKKSFVATTSPHVTNGIIAPSRGSVSASNTRSQGSNVHGVLRTPCAIPFLTVLIVSWKQRQVCTIYAFAIASVISNDEPKPYF